jgi:hypothetical protein
VNSLRSICSGLAPSADHDSEVAILYMLDPESGSSRARAGARGVNVKRPPDRLPL